MVTNNNIITKYLTDDSYVVVGCSAGPDSMAPLSMMIEYKKDKIVCCHINHNVREESKKEEEYLRDYCQKKGVIFETMMIDSYHENNFENEARKKRYAFYEEILNKYHSKYLFLAHHGDDLIETVLMKIVRGSNITGYSGIKETTFVNGYYIIRPLLDYTKDDLIIYNNENKGIANGLNNCLGHSKGKYIAIMDADDLSLPNRLKSEVSYLESHPDISVVGSSMIVFDSHGDRGIRSLPVILNRDSFLVGSAFAHPTTMIRRSVIKKLGGYSVFKNRALDLDLWFRLYKQGFKGVNLREPLYKYRETVSDYKRRTFSASLDISKTFFYGFKEISIPWYQRWRALKPIISSLLPSSLLDIYRKSKLK